MKEIFKDKSIIEILAMIIIVIAIIKCLTGCTDADIASQNISKEADMFRVKRRITFINLRSDEYLFSLIGNCSITTDNTDEQLEVTCKVGEDKYQKHFLRLSEETTYVVEQLEYSEVSKYDYEIVFKPKSIIPYKIEVD
jgi:hypothetical protein